MSGHSRIMDLGLKRDRFGAWNETLKRAPGSICSIVEKVHQRKRIRAIAPVATDAGEHLWVDKYAPKKFTDLISLDSVNVEVLRWCIAWKEYCRTKGRGLPSTTDCPEKPVACCFLPLDITDWRPARNRQNNACAYCLQACWFQYH